MKLTKAFIIRFPINSLYNLLQQIMPLDIFELWLTISLWSTTATFDSVQYKIYNLKSIFRNGPQMLFEHFTVHICLLCRLKETMNALFYYHSGCKLNYSIKYNLYNHKYILFSFFLSLIIYLRSYEPQHCNGKFIELKSFIQEQSQNSYTPHQSYELIKQKHC